VNMAHLPQAISQRLEGIRQVLMAYHRAGLPMPDATKGTEREILIREFLERVFPPPYRFGTGAVVDSSGVVSGQLDVVVEFPFFPSFPPPGGTQRLYLAESVAFVIEVKSDLSSQWAQVEETVAKVRPLRRQWLRHASSSPNQLLALSGPSASRLPVAVVGFKGYSDLDSLANRLNATSLERRPDLALVVESGACVGLTARGLGPSGLFAFCVDCSYFARNVVTAEPDLNSYLSET